MKGLQERQHIKYVCVWSSLTVLHKLKFKNYSLPKHMHWKTCLIFAVWCLFHWFKEKMFTAFFWRNSSLCGASFAMFESDRYRRKERKPTFTAVLPLILSISSFPILMKGHKNALRNHWEMPVPCHHVTVTLQGRQWEGSISHPRWRDLSVIPSLYTNTLLGSKLL